VSLAVVLAGGTTATGIYTAFRFNKAAGSTISTSGAVQLAVCVTGGRAGHVRRDQWQQAAVAEGDGRPGTDRGLTAAGRGGDRGIPDCINVQRNV
jgi:hypothetical protein